MTANDNIISYWAKLSIPYTIYIKSTTNKAAVLICGLILLLIFGIIIFALLSLFLMSFQNAKTPDWNYLLVAIIIILFCTFSFLYIINRRRSLIGNISSKGISTVGNEFYSWDQLEYIFFDVAQKKYSLENEKIYYVVTFIFKDGKARGNHRMNEFVDIIDIAIKIPVRKKEKVTIMYS